MRSVLAMSLAWLLAAASVDAHADNYRLYLAPDGDDSAAGTSATAPLQTLQAALARVQAENPAGDVDVAIAPGTYSGQSVAWTYTGAASVTFAPPAGAAAMPVFDGGGADTWFKLRGAAGAASNLHFTGLHVRNYWMAIDLGSSNAAKDANSGNVISGMRFERIGGEYGSNSIGYSYAAIRLQHSSGNTIEGNSFSHVENATAYSGYIHALYLANASSDNVVRDNSFTDVNGDVVRTRNASNGNLVQDNSFLRAGKYAAFSDWFDQDDGDECPSQGNRFIDNSVGVGYYGTIPATATTGDDDACGALTQARIDERGTVYP